MKIEKADAILLALYAGALHGEGFSGVTAAAMETEKRDFGWALYVLQMRGWISGCVFQPPGPGDRERLMGVIRDNLQLTPEGFKRAEEMAAERAPAKGRATGLLLQGAFELLRDIGCGVMANTIYNWL